MGFSFANKFKALLPGVVLAGALAGAASIALPEPARAISPAYTTTGALGGNCVDDPTATPPYSCGTQQSYGFFFDTDRDVTIDALGFAAQQAWTTGSSSYEVKLWSYINGGNALSDYTLIDSVTFTPGVPYTLQDNYFWQDIIPTKLFNSLNNDPGGQIGFVIGVVGDFSTSDPGNVQYEGGVVPNFRPGIVNNDSGYNGGPNTDPFWSVPVYPGGQGATAFFNGNLSFAPVPGPLPMLGAAAAFSCTRRMRQRIRLSR